MATKKKADSKKTEPDDSGVLKATAEAIGSALGTLAAKSGLLSSAKSTAKPGKLVKKNKSRLPRKAKKQLAKARAAK